MFPNLRAEQARRSMSNQQVADHLGICRNSYESKVKTGKFTVEEIRALCRLFRRGFDYLFSPEPDEN